MKGGSGSRHGRVRGGKERKGKRKEKEGKKYERVIKHLH